MFSEKLFRATRTIFERDQQTFAVVLSRMDLCNVDTWNVFVCKTVKSVITSTDSNNGKKASLSPQTIFLGVETTFRFTSLSSD